MGARAAWPYVGALNRSFSVPQTVAILIPEPGSALPWRVSLDALKTALAMAEVEVVTAPWTAPVGQEAKLVLPLLAWGYHEDTERWFERIAALGDRLVNPPEVLRWNTRKTYLLELEAAGVAVVPTRHFARLAPGDVAGLLADFGTEALVIKPVTSASSIGVQVVRSGEDLGAARQDVLAQPFLESIKSEGEISLLYVEGRFSHAVRKAPKAGEYRVQVQFGGSSTLCEPEAEALAVAETALAQSPAPVLYARVDVVRRADGRWAVMELELIEPDLFLELAPDQGLGFARAVRARISP